MRIIKLSQWAKENSYSYRGDQHLFAMRQIDGAYKTNSGSIRIKVPEEKVAKLERNVIYARVRSSQNRGNLETQADRISQFCNAKGWIIGLQQ